MSGPQTRDKLPPHRSLGGNCHGIGRIAADLLACGTLLPQRSRLQARFCRSPSLDPPPVRTDDVRTSWNECLSQSPTRDNMTMATGMYVVQKMVEEHVTSSSLWMLRPPIKSAALIDPIWNWPQLIGGRVIGARLDQVTIDHDFPYDALAADEIELRSLICWPAGECGRGQQRGGSDRHDPYLAEHPPPRTNFRLGGRHRAGRTVEPSRGLEPEVLAQAALFTIAGGAWSPAVAATGRTVGGGRGLSEGRAGKQRDQRESSDECLHDASPCYGRLS